MRIRDIKLYSERQIKEITVLEGEPVNDVLYANWNDVKKYLVWMRENVLMDAASRLEDSQDAISEIHGVIEEIGSNVDNAHNLIIRVIDELNSNFGDSVDINEE